MAEETKDHRPVPAPVLLAHRVAEEMGLGPEETDRAKSKLAGLAMRMSKSGNEPDAASLLAAFEAGRERAPVARRSFGEEYAGIVGGLHFQENFDSFDRALDAAATGNHHAIRTLREFLPDKEILSSGCGEDWALKAATAGNVETFRLLKDMGVNFSRKKKPKNAYLTDPAEAAAAQGHMDVLRFLKEEGADLARMKDGTSVTLDRITPYAGGGREVLDKEILDCAV
jgi:hypothetical protein